MITQYRSLPNPLHWVLTGFVLVLICLTCVMVRLAWLSGEYMQAVEIAEQNQDDAALIDACMGAVRNYFPGNPYCETAAENIIQKAAVWMEQDRQDEALAVLKDLRAAIYGIQSFYQPLSNELHTIEEHIKRLEAAKNE